MGHIQKRQGRGWVARYRDPSGHEHSRSFTRKLDAERFLSQVEVDKLRGDWVDPRHGQMHLSDWIEINYANVGRQLRASTLARDHSYIRNHLTPAFGKRPLSSITHLDVQTWIGDLTQELAPATVHKAVQILSKLMREAVHSGMLARSPCDHVELPRIDRVEMQILTPGQIVELTEEMDPRYRAMIPTLAYTGLRIGELLALQERRLDLLHRRVEVAETVVEVAGRLVINPPKTRAGHRNVPLTQSVASELSALLSNSHDGNADRPVFEAPQGGHIRLASFRRRFWNPAVKGAGFDGLRIHDLRHTAVSLWISAGASPKAIATWAGHSSVVTVLDRYGHLLPGDDDRITDALDTMANDAASVGLSQPPGLKSVG